MLFTDLLACPGAGTSSTAANYLPAQRPELEARGAKEKQGLSYEPNGSLCKIVSRGLGCPDSWIECVDLITENSAKVGVDSGLACTVHPHACHACQLPQTGRDLCLHLGQEGASTYRQAGGRKLPSTPQNPNSPAHQRLQQSSQQEASIGPPAPRTLWLSQPVPTPPSPYKSKFFLFSRFAYGLPQF